MNIENLKKVRARIAAAPAEHCNMKEWHCGSVMCIGGFTEDQMIADRIISERDIEIRDADIDSKVDTFLGITSDEADYLFFSYPSTQPLYGWKGWMLARLDEIIATGEITYAGGRQYALDLVRMILNDSTD